jgi:hypothetical protein
VTDEEGNFDWSVPDQEVHTLVNDFEPPVGTYLYGRRKYEAIQLRNDEDHVVPGRHSLRACP